MKELSIKEKAKVYTDLYESEDERIRKTLINYFNTCAGDYYGELKRKDILAWLEKQGKQKETNLVEILKYYPKETELYSPLYGRLWLAEVDEKNEIIICYKHHLEEGCTRAVLEQEDTVSFYSNGTTGLPDFNISKDCMLFLYDIEKQGEQKSLYVRFGNIPDNEQSKIYNGENEIGIENGVSVYPAFIDGDNVILGLTLPITKTTLYTQQHLLEYDARPCYLVTGDYVGKGTDGEPLIKNISIIKEIKNYRIKELEKQGEQKPVIEMKTPEESLGIDSETYNEIINACIFGENKQKFKIGDWIIYSNEEVHLITGFDDNGYFVDKESYIPFNCEGNMRLWTIVDAKKGDILAEDPWSDYPSSFVAIYKKQNEKDFDTFDSYCFVGFDGKFYEGECGHSSEDIHPATKEQRDLIFKKMYEAGYEWDAEKKELKKINKQHLITNYFNAEYERGKTDALKFVAWGEENENRINHLIAYFEDKEGFTAEDDIAYANWLKSLKERCTWKPSDEQMHAFKQVYDWYNNDFAPSETLTSLYNDLKKLKG